MHAAAICCMFMTVAGQVGGDYGGTFNAATNNGGTFSGAAANRAK